MPLGPGTRLGPCEIVAAIGAGGMGEVYRALDTRLKRDVAINVPFLICPSQILNDSHGSNVKPMLARVRIKAMTIGRQGGR